MLLDSCNPKLYVLIFTFFRTREIIVIIIPFRVICVCDHVISLAVLD